MFVPNLEKSPQFEVPLVKYIFCVEKKKKPLSSRAGSSSGSRGMILFLDKILTLPLQS